MADRRKSTPVLQLAVLVTGIGIVLLLIGAASITHAIKGGVPIGVATVAVATGMLAYASRLFRGYRVLLRRDGRRQPSSFPTTPL